jgi:preprotein translocase subunit SecG
MYYLLVGVYVLICFLLLVVVLLQQGKGGDIAAAFGGSSSQTAFGARAGATFLTRATTVLATLFMLGAFALGLVGKGGTGSSVVSGVQGPAQATPAGTLPMTSPLPTPTTPAESPTGSPAASPSPGGAGKTAETPKPTATKPPGK